MGSESFVMVPFDLRYHCQGQIWVVELKTAYILLKNSPEVGYETNIHEMIYYIVI